MKNEELWCAASRHGFQFDAEGVTAIIHDSLLLFILKKSSEAGEAAAASEQYHKVMRPRALSHIDR